MNAVLQRQHDRVLTLSPTKVSEYETCPRKYFFKYVLRLTKAVKTVHLGFGIAVHAAIEAILRNMLGGVEQDPKREFEIVYDEKVRNTPNKFPKGMDADSLHDTGISLVEQYQAEWERTGLVPLFTPAGEIMVEYKLESQLTPGVNMLAYIDTACTNDNGGTVLVDAKTVKSASPDALVYQSDQLAMQQVLLNENSEQLEIAPVEEVGFMEGTKAKVPELKKSGEPKSKGPQVLPLKLVPAYSVGQLGEFKQKWMDIAERIKAEDFPKRALSGYNSPCGMCDYAAFCSRGDKTGLVETERFSRSQPQQLEIV